MKKDLPKEPRSLNKIYLIKFKVSKNIFVQLLRTMEMQLDFALLLFLFSCSYILGCEEKTVCPLKQWTKNEPFFFFFPPPYLSFFFIMSLILGRALVINLQIAYQFDNDGERQGEEEEEKDVKMWGFQESRTNLEFGFSIHSIFFGGYDTQQHRYKLPTVYF